MMIGCGHLDDRLYRFSGYQAVFDLAKGRCDALEVSEGTLNLSECFRQL